MMPVRILKVIALWAVLCMPGLAWAAGVRSYGFERLSVVEGLSQSAVTCIHQERSGILWIGTEDGLNRYDGFEFKVFNHDAREAGSLPKDFVWAIHEDPRGRLWIGGDGGLSRFRPLEQDFENWRHDPADSNSLSNDVVRAIATGPDGSLWIGTDGGGISRFAPDDGTWTRYRHDPDDVNSLGSDRVRTIFFDGAQRMWVGTYEGGLDRFDSVTGRFSRADLGDDALSVFSIEEDRSGKLWLGTYGSGLYHFDPANGSFEHYAKDAEPSHRLPGDQISSIVIDPADNLWVGTDEGLVERNPVTGRTVVHRHDATNRDSLSSTRITSLLADRGGVLWVGTKTGGLNKYPLSSTVFRLYQQVPGEASISSDTVTAFTEDSAGNIWVGTFGGGLNRIDAATGEITVYGPEGDHRGITDARVMSLLSTPEGIVWVGTRKAGLFRLDTRTGKTVQYLHDPEDPTTLPGNGIVRLYRDNTGSLWVSVFDAGLARFDAAHGTFHTYRNDPDNPSSLPGNRVTSMVEDAEGVLWIGIDGAGLARMDRRSGEFTHYPARPEVEGGLATNDIYSLHVSSDNTLWIGTQGSGVSRWGAEDRREGAPRFERFDEHNGLPNNQIYGILEDEVGRLWMSTNKGLACLSPSSGRIRSFDASHGLQSNEFNFGAYYRASDGEMFFGGIAGYNAFLPGQVKEDGFEPPIVLTGISKLSEAFPFDPLAIASEGLVLTHKDYVTTFNFAALDYSAPENTRYRYRLRGYTEGWIELGHNRVATLTNLPPGDFTLEVRGTNGNGDWSPHQLEVPLKVLPPPWKSWWAYMLYSLAIVGLAFLYARSQQKKLRREEEYSRKLESEVKARTHELAERNRDLEELNERLQAASVTDPLTGLHNRRYLADRIPEDVAVIERRINPEGGEPVFDILFLMVDLDNLKYLNDHYGHLVGDRAILQVAAALRRTCRASDTIVRWGGDEFMVVAREISLSSARALARRIGDQVNNERFALDDGSECSLSCSMGFAFFPFTADANMSWEQVVGIADQALYVSKRKGRNRWSCLLGNERTPVRNLYDRISEQAEEMVDAGEIDLETEPVGAEAAASDLQAAPDDSAASGA